MDGLKARLSFDAVAYDYDDEYLTIDTDTHTININNVSRLFGVQYDGNSKLIKFKIRNKLSDIQKMQDSIVYINWIDSRGVKGQSIAINKTINNDTCEFAWKVPFDALKNSGVLLFAMSAVVTKNSSSVIDQRWSTQIASVITPDGIYIKSYTPSSEEEDRIAQIYNELSNMINKQNDNLQSQVNSLQKDLDNHDAKVAMNLNDLNNLIENTNIAYGAATCTSDWKKADILKFDLKSGISYKVFVTLENAPTGSTYVYLDRGTGVTDSEQMNGKTEHIFSIVPSVDSKAILQINSGSYTGKVNAYVSVQDKKNVFEKINEQFEKNEFEFNDTVANLCFYEASNISVKLDINQTDTKNDVFVSDKVKLPTCESYFIEFENALISPNSSGYIEIKICEYDISDKVVSRTIIKLTGHKALVKKSPTAVRTAIIISYSNTSSLTYLSFNKIRLYVNAKKNIREDVQVKINDTSNVKYLKSIIPKYWIENESDYTMYLEDKIKSANSIISDAKFAFITDLHWHENAKNSNNIFGYVTKKMGIMNCFNGGDILMNMSDTPLVKQAKFYMNSYMSDLNDIILKNLHYIMGNHDTNQTNAPSGATSSDYDNARLSYKDIYEACIEPWKNGKHFSDRLEWASWAIGTPQYYWNRMHYYVDDEKSRIRYIVLNSGAYGEIASLVGSNGEEFYWQLNWLYDTLMNITEGWTCIVFAHQFLSDKEIDAENHYYDIWDYSKPIANMLISARNKTVYRTNFTHAQVFESYDFTNIKSIDVACMICGHNHVDESIIYDTSKDTTEIGNTVTSNSQILVICTTCDVYANTVHPQYEMIKGTTTEQAFDVFSIDKTNKKIYTTRFGVGEDREFKYFTN